MAEPKPADLVLSGGGVKGIGLVGAVVALMNAGYSAQRVSGTSAGSIVGAVVAAASIGDQLSPEEVKELASGGSDSGRGRIIFALDATASRQPTWDTACQLQAEMFREVAAVGGLSVQLVYYRGTAECRASRWVTRPEHLSGLMERIDCQMGHTQIGKVLAHARRESELLKVQALVFVGDAMEENPDDLARAAAALGKAA